jgi:serine/threonine protein kinase
MIETGKVLQQRYRIDKQIGQGGMGAVYIATDERFGSTVAIKQTLLMDDNYRKAIEREARLLNSLKHVALPRVSDHFLEENGQFLVMEYIPGEDLSHMIESGTVFEIDRVLKWADQLLDALEYLHNQSIPVIHRDIKPQNLKLTASDQIILLDFGLAKGNPTDAGHQTAAKSIFGYSRNYASLEQIQGTGTDPRSDLYSLAATMYHLLTGVPPEDALTRAMAVLSGKPDPLQPANSIRPAIPRGVAAVLQKCLALNADDRPSSAAEMREALRDNAKYAPFLEQAIHVASPTHADVLAEKTRIMPSATRQETSGQTDVKTAVMPGFVSQETSLRQVIDTGEVGGRKRGRGGWVVASALAAILIACGTAAGLYVFDPGLFGVKTQPVAAQPEAKPEPPVVTQQQQRPLTADADANAPAQSPSTTTQPEITKPSSSTVAKNGELPKPAKPNNDNENVNIDMGDVKVQGSTVYVGNTKITPNGITGVSPNIWIDRNGVKRPVPPQFDPMPFPGITKEEFDRLTPEQKQKLREARRRMMNLERQRVPQQPSTPHPPN